jgi:DNA-binding transcriptional LysR family regulator
LQRGELDLVVGRLPEFLVHANVRHKALYRERISVLVRRGHPLVGRGKLKLAELATAAWILPPPETTVRRRLESLFQKAGLEPPRPAVQSISLAISRRLVLETDMLAVLPDLAVDDEMRAGLIHALPLALPPASVGISRRRDALLAPAAQALIEAVEIAARGMQA